jgi:hypothetical protein
MLRELNGDGRGTYRSSLALEERMKWMLGGRGFVEMRRVVWDGRGMGGWGLVSCLARLGVGTGDVRHDFCSASIAHVFSRFDVVFFEKLPNELVVLIWT